MLLTFVTFYNVNNLYDVSTNIAGETILNFWKKLIYIIEEFEDTKGVIRVRNTMAKRKSSKGQTTIYKTYI